VRRSFGAKLQRLNEKLLDDDDCEDDEDERTLNDEDDDENSHHLCDDASLAHVLTTDTNSSLLYSHSVLITAESFWTTVCKTVRPML